MTKTSRSQPLRTSTTVFGTYDTMAERPSGHRATHPVTKQDLGEAMDRLLRVKERGRGVSWNVGYGVGSDGCAYSGGMCFTTKREALKVWNRA